VILHSASKIDLSTSTGVALLATGGEGGAGKGNTGGAYYHSTGVKELLPHNDACPPGYPAAGANSCKGHVDGAGGDGGLGIVQLHAPGGPASILLPAGVTLDEISKPLPVCWNSGCYLLPLTSARRGEGSVETGLATSELEVAPRRRVLIDAQPGTLYADLQRLLDVVIATGFTDITFVGH